MMFVSLCRVTVLAYCVEGKENVSGQDAQRTANLTEQNELRLTDSQEQLKRAE